MALLQTDVSASRSWKMVSAAKGISIVRMAFVLLTVIVSRQEEGRFNLLIQQYSYKYNVISDRFSFFNQCTSS